MVLSACPDKALAFRGSLVASFPPCLIPALKLSVLSCISVYLGRTRAYLRIKHACLLDAVSTDLQVMPLTGLQQVAGFLSF